MRGWRRPPCARPHPPHLTVATPRRQVIYASAINRKAGAEPDALEDNMTPLYCHRESTLSCLHAL